jgi:hypothetical protein
MGGGGNCLLLNKRHLLLCLLEINHGKRLARLKLSHYQTVRQLAGLLDGRQCLNLVGRASPRAGRRLAQAACEDARPTDLQPEFRSWGWPTVVGQAACLSSCGLAARQVFPN